MSNYINESLIGGEKISYTGTLSLWSVSGFITFGCLFVLIGLLMMIGSGPMGLALIGVSCVLFAAAYITFKSTQLAITDKRVIAKFGFISRHTIEINIKKVESIQIKQGIFGRIFNYGSLVISGAGNPQAPIPGISKPMEFRKAFLEAQDRSEATKK